MVNNNTNKKSILVTGAAWFIGSNLVKIIIETMDDVLLIGIDNMNDYYDVLSWSLTPIIFDRAPFRALWSV